MDVPALRERPELYDDLIYVWQAFLFLSCSRPIGMGVGSIPIGEIESYCNFMQIYDFEERFEYLRLIKALDGEFLKAQNKEHEQKSKKNTPSKKAPARRR